MDTALCWQGLGSVRIVIVYCSILFYFPSDTENKRQNHGNAENKGYKQNL
jgi:hypothetical protein